ncbi:sigma-70 family RNA polymerase sigma factor [Draconibacterium sp.]|jgi:RNA polymerase sigma factor (sigma-70 family)
MMQTDKKTWDDFRNGMSYALSHIYYQHVHILFSYGKKFSKDDEIIKDTIQDLFFDLIRTRQKLNETDNIKFYLFRAFRRKLIKNIEKQKLSIDFHLTYKAEEETISSAEKDIIDDEELTTREKIVQEALATLSKKQREILYYRFNCNFEYEQICEIMSLKYDSARKQVFRALKALKATLPDSITFLLFLSLISKM